MSIGLAETDTAIIIGIAGALDFALFYAGGQLMDRFGRGATAIPSMIGLGLGHLALAASVLALDPVPWFVAVACVLAAANGIGSGILMTIGADLAPPPIRPRSSARSASPATRATPPPRSSCRRSPP